jgi:methionyl-tRNA formyltransferase
MKNIIVFGNVPLATWVVKKILSCNNLNLLGVVCDVYAEDFFMNHGMEEKSLYSFCKLNDLPIINFDEAFRIAKNKKVLGISVRYHNLFKEEYFNAFQPGIINLHGGELPRYRGANIANYIILEKHKQAGGTLHFIDKGIDEGDIVERELFELKEYETAYSVFTKTLKALQVAFNRFIKGINVEDDVEINRISQNHYIKKGEEARTYFKKGIENFRFIDFSDKLDWDELDLRTRAFYFPGHKGVYLKKNNSLIELTYVNSDDSKKQ